MARSVWKYPLNVQNIQEVKMPKGAQILCVQLQYEKPCLWALVDPFDDDEKTRLIAIVGTGHAAPGDGHRYIGTFQLQGGDFIFHVFEQTE